MECKPSILFVDDDKNIQDAIKILLSNLAREHYIANDGIEGIELFKKYKPDIILTDINMPNLDGLRMSEEIKKIDSGQAIIIITAFDEGEHLIDAINLNLDGYIVKPIIFENLIKSINSVYEKIKLKKEFKLQQEIIIQSEKMVSMGEMIGNIAHQWRQPLNALGGLLANLQIKYDNGTLSDEFLENYFVKSEKLIEKMSSTIDDFRNFFNPDKQTKLFNVCDAIKESIEFLKDAYGLKDAKINFENKKSKCEINSFKNEFIQVILNLCNNSFDAYKEQEFTNKIIDISVDDSKDDYIHIYVKDYAGGIDEEILSRVFEPYFTTKYKSDGTGIGLYMCKLIIENSMNGVLAINNTLNGVEAKISLPKK